MRVNKFAASLLVALLTFLVGPLSFAQETTSSLRGVVSDSGGKALSGGKHHHPAHTDGHAFDANHERRGRF